MVLCLAVVLVTVLGVLLARGRPVAGATLPSSPVAAKPLLDSSAEEVAKARTQLDELVVEARPAVASDYRRAAFGRSWADIDGNGCNQRDDVLLRDRETSEPYRVARQGTCDHDVLAGTWFDPYTGSTIVLTDAKEQQQAQSVQIDHLVPLSVAWRDGASTWTDAERLTFANDLRNLLAVGGAANQAKGGSDAAQWQPVAAARCGYAVRYLAVKAAYGLPARAAEKRALAQMLSTCD